MTANSDRTQDRTPTGSRPDVFVPLADAAQRLGISYDAARRRIARGTLPAEKRGDRWFVSMPAPDSGPDAGPDATGPAPDALVVALQDEVAYLRQQLDHQTHIIAGLVQRLPELPAGDVPQERDPGPVRDVVATRASETLIDRLRRLLGR